MHVIFGQRMLRLYYHAGRRERSCRWSWSSAGWVVTAWSVCGCWNVMYTMCSRLCGSSTSVAHVQCAQNDGVYYPLSLFPELWFSGVVWAFLLQGVAWNTLTEEVFSMFIFCSLQNQLCHCCTKSVVRLSPVTYDTFQRIRSTMEEKVDRLSKLIVELQRCKTWIQMTRRRPPEMVQFQSTGLQEAWEGPSPQFSSGESVCRFEMCVIGRCTWSPQEQTLEAVLGHSFQDIQQVETQHANHQLTLAVVLIRESDSKPPWCIESRSQLHCVLAVRFGKPCQNRPRRGFSSARQLPCDVTSSWEQDHLSYGQGDSSMCKSRREVHILGLGKLDEEQRMRIVWHGWGDPWTLSEAGVLDCGWGEALPAGTDGCRRLQIGNYGREIAAYRDRKKSRTQRKWIWRLEEFDTHVATEGGIIAMNQYYWEWGNVSKSATWVDEVTSWVLISDACDLLEEIWCRLEVVHWHWVIAQLQSWIGFFLWSVNWTRETWKCWTLSHHRQHQEVSSVICGSLCCIAGEKWRWGISVNLHHWSVR